MLTQTIKIPAGSGRYFFTKRHKRKVYQTNKFGKAFAFYCVLKTLTDSGKITNWFSQIDLIKSTCKISSTQTIYTYLHICKKLHLLQFDKDIVLLSWSKLCQKIDIEKKFIHFKYSNDEKQTPGYFLAQEVLLTAKRKREFAVIKKASKNLELQELIGTNTITNKTIDSLAALQVANFTLGNENLALSKYDSAVLNELNFDTEIKVHSIKNLFNYKSYLSAIYCKRQLSRRGFIAIEKRNLTSIAVMRKDRDYKTYQAEYNPAIKATFWKLPDKLVPLNEFRYD